ncbi:vitelline membrane outer layer protein 1-like isoform X2 [Struthio camelus]|uniref:vitelline membrane outer layer protein 1-like isoform X2 n=1 Tax=Struthio camelus TaxID=8801 RepID=UPI0036041A03
MTKAPVGSVMILGRDMDPRGDTDPREDTNPGKGRRSREVGAELPAADPSWPQVEKGQKPTKDHVALTGVGLLCTDSNLVTSAQGSWGVWSHSIVCPAGLLTRFRLRVQAPQGDFDDTAANSAEFACADGSRLRLPAGTRGRWGDWSPRCSPGTAVCGLQTRVQPPQGNGDDTALNDLRLLCCS